MLARLFSHSDDGGPYDTEGSQRVAVFDLIERKSGLVNCQFDVACQMTVATEGDPEGSEESLPLDELGGLFCQDVLNEKQSASGAKHTVGDAGVAKPRHIIGGCELHRYVLRYRLVDRLGRN